MGADYAPVVTIEDFYRDREAFRRRCGVRAQIEFRYPIQPGPDVTVLVSGFRPTERVQVISDPASCDIRSLRGRALAAPVAVLRHLARPGRVLDYPVVVFTGPRFGVMTQDDRDLFWATYEVPVFEQMLGINSEVVAAECEAHEGLHVDSSVAHFQRAGSELVVTSSFAGEYSVPRLATGIIAQLVEGRCACGHTGVRLVDVRPAALGRAVRAGSALAD